MPNMASRKLTQCEVFPKSYTARNAANEDHPFNEPLYQGNRRCLWRPTVNPRIDVICGSALINDLRISIAPSKSASMRDRGGEGFGRFHQQGEDLVNGI